MPSATANNGSATKRLSWLVSRTAPTSVADPQRNFVIALPPSPSDRLVLGHLFGLSLARSLFCRCDTCRLWNLNLQLVLGCYDETHAHAIAIRMCRRH